MTTFLVLLSNSKAVCSDYKTIVEPPCGLQFGRYEFGKFNLISCRNSGTSEKNENYFTRQKQITARRRFEL